MLHVTAFPLSSNPSNNLRGVASPLAGRWLKWIRRFNAEYKYKTFIPIEWRTTIVYYIALLQLANRS